ncbi:hypothetical protein [Spiroplasma endosymbiont of Danaus chrysippus]|uniref:hypothetical protein n=1 Tax=Spiroplasma endosymbiont of Danaus chrysippus TaxID=2691041 RepID=UPI00157A6964|nr:hypothetical protein [Spiroplasma endosymbiont of Danaus chrysippus]
MQDNLGNHNNIYLQIAPKQEIAHYFDTDNGKQFEKWAKANGHDNIHGYSVRQLNKLFEESKSWIKQANDNQLANALADWFKTKGNVSSKQIISKEEIVEQLKQQIPKTITIDKFDTSNYDLNKVSFEIKGMQFQPNEKVEIVIKYGSEKSNSFILQIQNNNPPNNNKKGLTVLAIIAIVIGSLLGLLLLCWLLKKFVITPFILEPMRKKKSEAFQRQTEKDIAQMKADEAEEETKRKGKK